MIDFLSNKYVRANNVKEKLEISLTLALFKSTTHFEVRKLLENKNGYMWTIRTREDSRHVPHFHVEKAGKQGSFELITGELVKDDCCNLSAREIKTIKTWYKEYRKGLIHLWNELHPERKVTEDG